MKSMKSAKTTTFCVILLWKQLKSIRKYAFSNPLIIRRQHLRRLSNLICIFIVLWCWGQNISGELDTVDAEDVTPYVTRPSAPMILTMHNKLDLFFDLFHLKAYHEICTYIHIHIFNYWNHCSRSWVNTMPCFFHTSVTFQGQSPVSYSL